MMRCSTCSHELSFHFDEGCCYQTAGSICPCTVAFAMSSSPPRASSVSEESVPTTPPQTCPYCNHATIAHGALGNCLACIPEHEGHVCRAVLLREIGLVDVVQERDNARAKYERLEVELGQALDELELLKKRYTALQDQKEKARWSILRAASRLDEALEELPTT